MEMDLHVISRFSNPPDSENLWCAMKFSIINSPLILLSVFLLLAGQSKLIAQQNPSFSDDMNHLGKTTSELFSRTFSPDEQAINTTLLALLASGTAGLADETIREFWKRSQSPFLDGLFASDEYYGNHYTLIPVAGIYTYGLMADDPATQRFGLKLMTASTLSIFYNVIIKTAIGRSRPFRDKGSTDFTPFSFSFEQTSFPSGHTTFTFAIAAVMEQEFNSPGITAAGYTAAVLTALARMYHDVHWFSDTVFGAVIGYYIGKFAAEELDRLSKKDALPGYSSKPFFTITIPLR